MREIKFRGRVAPRGKQWFYGDLDTHTSDVCILDNDALHTVISETVGQFTGLKDSTGKEIYEGDIVKLSPQFSAKQGLKCEFRFPAVVRWDERLARFSVRSMEIVGYLCHGLAPYGSEYITVIGNIHDNPELLEATEGGRP